MDIPESGRPAIAIADKVRPSTAREWYEATPVVAAVASGLRVMATLDPSPAATLLPETDERRSGATRSGG
jgi:hypothetical protein